MNHKEFFKILVGNPPPEIEFEIEVKQRETEQMPEEAVRLAQYTQNWEVLDFEVKGFQVFPKFPTVTKF